MSRRASISGCVDVIVKSERKRSSRSSRIEPVQTGNELWFVSTRSTGHKRSTSLDLHGAAMPGAARWRNWEGLEARRDRRLCSARSKCRTASKAPVRASLWRATSLAKRPSRRSIGWLVVLPPRLRGRYARQEAAATPYSTRHRPAGWLLRVPWHSVRHRMCIVGRY